MKQVCRNFAAFVIMIDIVDSKRSWALPELVLNQRILGVGRKKKIYILKELGRTSAKKYGIRGSDKILPT